MRTTAWMTAILVASIALASAAVVDGGRGRGGSSPDIAEQRRGQTQQMKESRRQVRETRKSRAETRERHAIRATEEQRRHYADVAGASRQLLERSRELARLSKRDGLTPGRASVERRELGREIRSMEQRHERLLGSLDAAQREMLRSRVETMTRSFERVMRRHRELDRALSESAREAWRVPRRARDLEMATVRWQSHAEELASELGVEPGGDASAEGGPDVTGGEGDD